MTDRRRMFWYLALAVSFTAVSCASHKPPPARSEAGISPTTEGKVNSVAVVPISLAEKSVQQNHFTVRVAERLTEYLQQRSPYQVVGQGDVSAALKRIGLKYENLAGATLPEIAQGLTGNDIIVFVGPHPGDESWFPCAVVRPRDMVGRTTRFWSGRAGDASLPDFKKMGIEAEIGNVFSAKVEAK